MKAGEVINGYRILEDFRVVGAGLSKWTFAAKDGREYFIKEFLSPTFPDEHAPGSAQTKMRKRQRCQAFERHHRRINEALAEVSGVGGNLIVTLAFFRWGAKYYKVTEKVEVAGLSPADVTALPFQDQLVLLKTVAHSLRILHDRGIVHGDLKPSNVLVKRTELGYTTKLIDFDSAYLAGEPPPPGRDRRDHELLLPGAGRLHPGDRDRRPPAHPEGRHLRPRPHLRRVPHRRPARLRRRPGTSTPGSPPAPARS